MIDAVCKGVMDLYNADDTLKAAVLSLHQEMALQDTILPFGTFDIVESMSDYTMGSDNKYCTVQFNIFTEKRSERADAFKALDAVYDKCAISITGYTLISMLRTALYMSDSRIENVWQLTVRYTIHATKN